MRRLFREVIGVEKALKQHIKHDIEQEWLLAITDRNSQSLTGTVAQILEFLYNTYGYVSTVMLESKEEGLKGLDYHPRQLDDLVFNTVEDLVDYAEMANTPFSQSQIIGKAYSKFKKTGLLSIAINEWNCKPAIQKTWIVFKAHFHQARKELKETSGDTISSSQLNETATLVQEVVEAAQQSLLPADGALDPTADILQQVVNSASSSSCSSKSPIFSKPSPRCNFSSMQTTAAPHHQSNRQRR